MRNPAVAVSLERATERLRNGAYSGILLYSGESSKEFGKKACASRDFILDHGCARIPAGKCDAVNEFAYFANSCWSGSTIGLLDWKTSPLVLKREEVTVDRVDSVAEALVYRHFQLNDRSAMTDNDFANPVFSFFRGIEPQMLFNDSILEKIVAKGFLNQHQTHSSSAIYDEPVRWEAEERMLDVVFPRDAPGASDIAPKYLYGIQTEELLIDDSAVFYIADYGNLLAVFDSTKLMNRMTITLGDSLSMFNEKKSRLNTVKYVTGTKQKMAGGGFIEAQVWGKLDLTDVERFLVNCPMLNPISPERIAEIYRLTHIPVYTCKVERVGVSDRYVPDALVAGKKD